MPILIPHHRRFFYAFLTGLLLRLFFVVHFPVVDDPDTAFYAEIARTWLAHGVYGSEEAGIPTPTYIRLPGYPAFLAAVFAIFGNDQYLPVLLIQTLVDLGSCFLIAAIAWEIIGEEAAFGAFLVSMLCPFTANYAAVALTETLSIFFTSLALWSAVKGIRVFKQTEDWGIKWWILCGVGISAATLFRPDGIILLITVWVFLFWKLFQNKGKRKILVACAVTTVMVTGVLTPWTWRNWVVFHEFQPLAPRYCNAPWEYAPVGFYQWFKTWPVEFASLYDIFWKVSAESSGEVIDLNDLPPQAFDNPAEQGQTLKLFKTLNETLLLTPELDAQFAELAQERIARSPVRYYLYLPVLRITDMWLRPRTEPLDMEQHWWRFDPLGESLFSLGYALLNFLLLIVAVLGMVKFRRAPCAGLLIGFVIIRSVFLGTLENPEPRYVLECFPVVLTFAGAGLSRCRKSVEI